MNASSLLFLGIGIVLLFLNIGLGRKAPLRYYVRLNLGFIGILGFEYMFARSGVLSNFESFPPPIFFFMTLILIAAVAASKTVFGNLYLKSPTPMLVFFHSFRFLAEWVIAVGVNEKIAPVQLSYHGYNFDLAVAASAVVISLLPFLHRNKKIVWAWNIFGMLSLVNILFIAMTSFPNKMRLFMGEPDNTWVAQPPYVFLPGILVFAAIFGHAILTRKLFRK